MSSCEVVGRKRRCLAEDSIGLFEFSWMPSPSSLCVFPFDVDDSVSLSMVKEKK